MRKTMSTDANSPLVNLLEEPDSDEAFNDANFDGIVIPAKMQPKQERSAWRSIEEYREQKALREQISDLFEDGF